MTWIKADLLQIAKLCVQHEEETIYKDDSQAGLEAIHWYKTTMLRLVVEIDNLQGEVDTLRSCRLEEKGDLIR